MDVRFLAVLIIPPLLGFVAQGTKRDRNEESDEAPVN